MAKKPVKQKNRSKADKQKLEQQIQRLIIADRTLLLLLIVLVIVAHAFA